MQFDDLPDLAVAGVVSFLRWPSCVVRSDPAGPHPATKTNPQSAMNSHPRHANPTHPLVFEAGVLGEQAVSRMRQGRARGGGE